MRIAPNEVHLDDPDNYDKIYTVGTKFYKARSFYGALGDQTGMFSTASNELHRRRRSPLNPFFSRRAVLELEDMVQAKAAKLCDRVQDGLDKGQAVNLHDGFRAVSMDVITDYAFDDCWNQLEREDMGAWFSDMVKNAGRTFWIMQQFPFLLKPMKSIPPKYAKKISPAISDMVDTQMVSNSEAGPHEECIAPLRFADTRVIENETCRRRGAGSHREWREAAPAHNLPPTPGSVRQRAGIREADHPPHVRGGLFALHRCLRHHG